MLWVIFSIIATWYLPLPQWLQVCITMCGTLDCLVRLIKLVGKLYDNW